jgi:undecaprenyl-diphosphatase
LEQVILWDHQLFLSINNGWQNPALDMIMPFFSRIGEIWPMALIIIPLFYLNDKENFYKHLAIFAGAMVLSGVVGRVIKHFIDRPRPLKEMATLIQTHQVYIHVIGKELREYSFPSGHTISAFSGATFLSILFKRWSPLFFSVAVLTGVSRIYMGAHFPTDVIGGMLVGSLATGLFYFLAYRYFFKRLSKPSAPLSVKGS